MVYLETLKQRVVTFLDTASYGQIIAILIGVCFLVSPFNGKKSPTIAGAPVIGYRAWYEPTFLLKIRFVTDAYNIIGSGYNSLKNAPFVVRRYDTDITVLPIKYLDEMRLIPRHKLNGKKAQIDNLVPRWTWTSVMMSSDLHAKVLTDRLNPNLQKYMDLARSEMEWAWNTDVPQPEEWAEIDIQQSMRMLVARMSAKVFMGHPACRNPDWLKISIEFTFDMFIAAFTLRMFPPLLHPIVAPFVPSRWRIRRQMATSKKIIGELIENHEAAVENGIPSEGALLDWMLDHGNERERSVEEMAGRQLILTLASIHTTSLNVANLLFDLCANPEWIPVLREEVEETIKAHGNVGERMPSRQWLQKLEKMDSCFVESQRFNPPILLNPQRVAVVPLKLKDGTEIPQGTRIAWAGHHHANDPVRVPSPETFDPMRNYRKRHSGPAENLTKFTAGQTDSNSLGFGYGGQSCPGRYFAVGEVKLILARLLLEFDFRYPEGKSRPKIMHADENVFIDPRAKIMMKRRVVA